LKNFYPMGSGLTLTIGGAVKTPRGHTVTQLL
jgi:hypothetical protein